MSKKCSLLVVSTELNNDLWEGFFKSLEFNWPNFNWPLFFSTETKNKYIKLEDAYKLEQDKIIRKAWSKRLLEALNEIKTEYVLIMLDDYYIKDQVQVERLDKCISWMENDSSIAVFNLQKFTSGKFDDGKFEGFSIRSIEEPYILNAQVGIWRKENLINLINPYENPWQFEVLGSQRVKKFNEYKFYCLNDNSVLPIDYYRYGVLVKGRWVKDEIVDAINKYNLDIDLMLRGIEKEPQNAQKDIFNSLYKRAQRKVNNILRNTYARIMYRIYLISKKNSN